MKSSAPCTARATKFGDHFVMHATCCLLLRVMYVKSLSTDEHKTKKKLINTALFSVSITRRLFEAPLQAAAAPSSLAKESLLTSTELNETERASLSPACAHRNLRPCKSDDELRLQNGLLDTPRNWSSFYGN